MYANEDVYPIVTEFAFIGECELLDCDPRAAHFLIDFERRRVYSLKPVDWHVVVSGIVNVYTRGARSYAGEERARRLVNVINCIQCCLQWRGK